MRRLQIYIDADVDEALAAEAARRSTSKAAIIRESVAVHLGTHKSRNGDPMAPLVGRYPGAPGSVDEVVYGPLAPP